MRRRAMVAVPEGSGMQVVSIRTFLEKADQGRIGAFTEPVIRLHCRISKMGKAFETSISLDP